MAHAGITRSDITIIGIAGGSGSGKSTICAQLIRNMAPAKVTHILQDNYYKSQDHLTPEQRALLNFDHPDAIEFGLLAQHLAQIRQGLGFISPEYDFATHTRRSISNSRPNKPAMPETIVPETIVPETIVPEKIVIVEGILILAIDALRPYFDATFFVDTTEATRYQRRLKRDIAARGRTEQSVTQQFYQTVAPMHQEFVQPSARFATCILNGEDAIAKNLEIILKQPALSF